MSGPLLISFTILYLRHAAVRREKKRKEKKRKEKKYSRVYVVVGESQTAIQARHV